MRLDVVVLHDLLDLSGRVVEVSLRAQTLGDDGDVVVVPGRIELVLDGSDVHFLLIYHYHHLFNIKIELNGITLKYILTCHLFLFFETPLYLDPLNKSAPILWCGLLGLASMIVLDRSFSDLMALRSSCFTYLN